LLAADGEPLTGADVMVFQRVEKPDTGRRIYDIPKFHGATDGRGMYTLPNVPVDDSMFYMATNDELRPNPFGYISNHGENGLLLIRVAKAGLVDYVWLDIIQCNLAFWSTVEPAIYVRLTELRNQSSDSPIVQSTFDSDDEGWTVIDDAGTWAPAFVDEGSRRYITAMDTMSGFWFFEAPPEFVAGMGGAYGGRLTFELKQLRVGDPHLTDDVVLQGDGVTLTCDRIPGPDSAWTPYSVLLDETGGWIDAATGDPADSETIRYVFASLESLRIRGDYQSDYSGDACSIDNVAVYPPLGPPELPIPGALLVSSRFDVDTEGWTILDNGSSTAPEYVGVGGDPGGYAFESDAATGYWYWRAPAKFLGDQSAAHGGTLVFNLKQSRMNDPLEADDVVLVGGGSTLAYRCPIAPGAQWTSFAVPLAADRGWFRPLTGRSPSPSEMLAVLSSLDELRIRGDYQSGLNDDVVSMDNVSLHAPKPRADFDDDNDVDQADFGHVQECLTGPGIFVIDLLCTDANLDDDDDVDEADVGIFQTCMSGADIPAEAGCGY